MGENVAHPLKGVRAYLREHFTEVDDEPRDGDYYVIRVVVAPNVIKRVKIHYIRLAIDDLPATVRKVGLAKQLIENGDVSFTFPKPPKKSIGLF